MQLRSPPSMLLCILSAFFASVPATPTIGIGRDYAFQLAPSDPSGFFSYSAAIKFADLSVPGDGSKMSDGQFVNLAMTAYNEMVALWKTAQLPSRQCPAAMVAFESEGIMYFASSILGARNVDLNPVDGGLVKDSVGWFHVQCSRTNGARYRNGGSCAEPNALRLYGDFHPPTGNPLTYQTPPTTGTYPRMATIVRTNGSPGTDSAVVKNIAPCTDSAARGYGCNTLLQLYGFKAIQDVEPDTNGQDNWVFQMVTNPRSQYCQVQMGF